MQTRAFGATGVQVSELVFGGGWVGGLLIHQDDDTRRAAIQRALAGGIDWIDTAPSYGDGQSETTLGWLLEEVDPKPRISTKVRLDLSRLDDLRGEVERSLEDSLKRLRMDSVELFQLHNPIAPETGDGAISVSEVLRTGGVADVLDRMRDQGLTRLTGITALGDGVACREVVESGRFNSAQVYYNILNPSAGRAMPDNWSGHRFDGLLAACKAHGVGVMNIRVLAAGVLATDQRHGRENPVTSNADLAIEGERARAAFEVLGTTHGTRAQTALRFALAHPDISCVVVGLADLAQLEEALAAAEMGALSPAALAALDQVYARDFGRP